MSVTEPTSHKLIAPSNLATDPRQPYCAAQLAVVPQNRPPMSVTRDTSHCDMLPCANAAEASSATHSSTAACSSDRDLKAPRGGGKRGGGGLGGGGNGSGGEGGGGTDGDGAGGGGESGGGKGSGRDGGGGGRQRRLPQLYGHCDLYEKAAWISALLQSPSASAPSNMTARRAHVAHSSSRSEPTHHRTRPPTVRPGSIGSPHAHGGMPAPG